LAGHVLRRAGRELLVVVWAAFQARLHPLWRTAATGCNLVENIADAIVGGVIPGRAESIARGILRRLKKAKPAG
jgi:hypothetical protein